LEEKNDQPKVQNNATVITPVKPKNTNSSLINNFIKNNDKPGTTGGDGNSGNPGNSGVPDGNPNTNGQGGTGNNPNYIGNGNSQGGPGGIGINLAGRKVLVPPDPVNDSKEEGVVVVTIKVDKKGNVIEAETNGRGTTTTSPILKAKAHQAALKAKFSPSDAFEEQIGTMKFVFKF
jgi:TonB family protein